MVLFDEDHSFSYRNRTTRVLGFYTTPTGANCSTPVDRIIIYITRTQNEIQAGLDLDKTKILW